MIKTVQCIQQWPPLNVLNLNFVYLTAPLELQNLSVDKVLLKEPH